MSELQSYPLVANATRAAVAARATRAIRCRTSRVAGTATAVPVPKAQEGMRAGPTDLSRRDFSP